MVCVGLVTLKMLRNNPKIIAGWCAGTNSLTSSTAFRCTGLKWTEGIYKLYYFPPLCLGTQKSSVYPEFSWTLSYVYSPPQVRWCLRGDIFMSFCPPMWICRKCFWPMFSFQSKFNGLQCSRKTAKMATIRFIERKMMVI